MLYIGSGYNGVEWRLARTRDSEVIMKDRSKSTVEKPHQDDDVIKWKHFTRYWPFVLEIHRSPVNSPDEGQWRGALTFSLSCAWTHRWTNNGDAVDLRRHRAHHDVIAYLAM